MAQSVAPLKHKPFAFLWTAALVSNIGTWMHEVGAGWLMTELTDNALMVSLVAASTTLPVFAFVLVAGVFADIFDRKRYLIVTQSAALIVAAGLTVMAWADIMTPWLLLAFTFAIGACAALMMPAWDAIIPELVPREDLPQAIALGSIGINAARAVGPALAGFIIAGLGSYAVFAINTLSFIGVIAALLMWRREVPESGIVSERFMGAVQAGLRFTRHTDALQIVLVRAALFFLPAIGLLSLLPLYVRGSLNGDATTLGYLQASMGVGAILTAFIIPSLKQRFTEDRLLLLAAGVLATSFLLLGLVEQFYLACLALFSGGIAWITAFSILRVKAQQAVPNWVRARAMSVMLMVSFGSMAFGSAIWGYVAKEESLSVAYLTMVAATVLFGLISIPLKLKNVGAEDHESVDFKGAHDELVYTPKPHEGPVQVVIEYDIEKTTVETFLQYIEQLAAVRRRNGAKSWSLLRDLQIDNRFVEQFEIADWAEHERQHARTGKADHAVHQKVFSCLRSGLDRPIIRHYLGIPSKSSKS